MKSRFFVGLLISLIILLGVGFGQEDSLIAYFPFDGDLKDATGHFGDGKVVGAKINIAAKDIEYTDGIKGKALLFNGRRGVVLPDDLIKDYDYSVSFLVNIESFTMHTPTFFGAYIDDNGSFHWVSLVPFGWSQGTLLWARDDVKDIWYDGLCSENLQTGKWYHVVLTVDHGKANIYVNGKQMISKVQINGQPNPDGLVPDVFSLKPGGVFAIGVNYWDLPLRGIFDELRIYDKVLSENEVLDLYKSYPI